MAAEERLSGPKRTSSSNAGIAPVTADRGKDGRALDSGPGDERPARECRQADTEVAGGSGDAYPYAPSDAATCEREAAGRGI